MPRFPIPLGCYPVSVYHPRGRGSPQGIDRAPDAPYAPGQNLGVDHGGLDVLMTERRLYGPDACLCGARRQVVPVLQAMRRPAQMRDKLRSGAGCGRWHAWRSPPAAALTTRWSSDGSARWPRRGADAWTVAGASGCLAASGPENCPWPTPLGPLRRSSWRKAIGRRLLPTGSACQARAPRGCILRA
jgi:hypothetical protein